MTRDTNWCIPHSNYGFCAVIMEVNGPGNSIPLSHVVLYVVRLWRWHRLAYRGWLFFPFWWVACTFGLVFSPSCLWQNVPIYVIDTSFPSPVVGVSVHIETALRCKMGSNTEQK